MSFRLAKKRVRYREMARKDQGNRCCYCKVEMTDSGSGLPTSCTAEHVVPQSQGGLTTRGNIKAACFKCNHLRADGPCPTKWVNGHHERNRRIDHTVADRQERKSRERLSMWRQSCLAK